MPVSIRVLACLAASLCLASPAASDTPDKPVQYVVISFDGAHDIAQWKRSRALAQATGARFTYFLSCVYLLSPETKDTYHAPGMKAGRSNVGFASSKQEVAERLEQIWAANGEGHEIASHGCGHFDGKDWTRADWKAEFSAFDRIFRDAWTINGIEPEPQGWQAFASTAIHGFRAPYLSTGPNLDAALRERGLTYDASTVSRGPVFPARKSGLRHFALPMVPEGPEERRIIAMDYNLFVRHSGGFERDDADGSFEERTYRAFMAAFQRQYDGERIPFQAGFHFTLMNGGAYWRALERFAGEVCIKADVECVTYGDLSDRLDEAAEMHAGG